MTEGEGIEPERVEGDFVKGFAWGVLLTCIGLLITIFLWRATR